MKVLEDDVDQISELHKIGYEPRVNAYDPDYAPKGRRGLVFRDMYY